MVFLIDAIKSNKEIGTIRQFKKDEIIAPENQFSTHGIGVLQALQLANALNVLPNNIIFYGIEIDVIVLDSTLSPCVQNAVEQLAAQLKNELNNYSN
ncbi:TPA: hydrogenase maturation protease [Legionella anisa]|uniref:hydrogenase maturation protease n=1 Tax=Legionella anisa TaxID=28082 RepID=UPI0030B90190